MRDEYEVCAICDQLAPRSSMDSIYVTDSHGLRTRIRVCSRCRSPTLTYIQAPEGFIPQGPNPATVLVTALAVLIICLGVFFGLIIGSSVGFAIMIGCALLGAGILSAEAASQCGL